MSPIDAADAALARLEEFGEDVSDLRRELAFALVITKNEEITH